MADAGGASGRGRRIAIATAGRFHVLDLARELAALGHEVRFYSMLPPSRTASFGLQADSTSTCCRWSRRWPPGSAGAPGCGQKRRSA